MWPARHAGVQLTALASAVLVSACGGSSGNTASSAKSPSPTPTKAQQIAAVDSSKLVTAEEASAAVGTSVQIQAACSGAQQASICIYASSDGTAFVYVIGEVLPDATTAQSINPDQFAAMMHASGVANAKVVIGIGDKAVEYTTSSSSGSSGIAIFVIKSNVAIVIAMAPTTDSTKIEALARTAVGRL